MNYSVKKADTQEEINACLGIRLEVFVKGQGINLSDDLDDKDAESDHYLLKVGNSVGGTARVRRQASHAKIERVAILETYRGKGLGNKIMKAILFDLQQVGVVKVSLGSQLHAIPFYEKLGFKVYGNEYFDAGIPHRDMQLELRDNCILN